MSVIELKKLKFERTQLRRKLTEHLNKLDELFTKEDVLSEINEEYLIAEDKANRLFKIDERVSELLLSDLSDENEQEYEREYNTMESYRDKWTRAFAKKLDFFDRAKSSKTDNGSIHSIESDGITSKHHLRNYRLPKLEINKFDGSIKNWISFWAQFRKIHENPELDDEEKFQYLIQFTLDNSPARHLIDSFPPSAKNYSKALEQLKRRFGRDELLIELYVRELLNLVLIQVTEGKNQMNLRNLYDKLETQLRCLESLGVTSDRYACMLYPLVESSLPDSILKEWERRRPSNSDISQCEDQNTETTRLKELMVFLRKEVESEERLTLVRESFNYTQHGTQTKESKNLQTGKNVPLNNCKDYKKSTATGLVNTKSSNTISKLCCIFCEGQHNSETCYKARNMSTEEIQKCVKEKACCFLCLKRGHTLKMCKIPKSVTCLKCGKRHSTLLCRNKPEMFQITEKNVEQTLSNTNFYQVLLQTLQVKLGNTNKSARLLIDTGSQRSYVTKKLVSSMKYKPIGEEELCHALFGGIKTEVKHHKRYNVKVTSMSNTYRCNFDALDSDIICSHVQVANKGPWANELKQLNIKLSDVEEGPIDILIGADIAGKLLTGQNKVLNCGLVAVETLLGWTIMGRVKDSTTSFMTLDINMLCTEPSVSNLWKLDTLGIEDPAEVKSRQQSTFEAEEHFKETVTILENGRYEVQLPWLDNHPPLLRNFNVAERRLEVTYKKLKSNTLVEAYDNVFSEWLAEDVIEKVTDEVWDVGHYLPHRPVIKESSTTKIRPVFDASASERGAPSLNHCLEKGVNLIELIPNVLLRFRLDHIGVIADIRKAFLQISLCEEDRDFLRFLWYDENGKVVIFRHKRVVFGVCCSPFLLGAVLKYNFDRMDYQLNSNAQQYSSTTINKLKECFYVDNCVTSVSSNEELQHFMFEAKSILADAQFDLRGWEYSDPYLSNSTSTPVLGLIWDKKLDVIKINVPEWNIESNLTKRKLLSATQKMFDVIGILCPATITLKILIQQTWKTNRDWDSILDDKVYKKFSAWVKEADILKEIKIPLLLPL